MIDEAQSRVVRDATLKKTGKGHDSFTAWLTNQPERKRPSLSKAVKFYTTMYFKQLRRRGIAVCMIYIPDKSAKKHKGVFVEWVDADGHLWAVAHIMERQNNRPTIEVMMEVRASHHALERISQRLETLDTQLIRDELSAAVAAMLMHDGSDGEFFSVTPHGFAVVKVEEADYVIKTWIESENAGAKYTAGGWTALKPEAGLLIETATGAPICKLRRSVEQ